jgi:predicted acetyltransferase/purine-nucleoside phosphorylase
MSIINSFDVDQTAVINPGDVLEKQKHKLDICIINFSYKIMDALLEDDLLELIDDTTLKCVSCIFPLYVYKGTNIGVVKTEVGAPMTVSLIENVAHAFSCKRFIMFGSCGGLDKNITANKLIVPTHAYRDEGISYHYVAAKDYIEIKNHNIVSQVLDKLNIPYIKGKTWTTDAFYRETRRNMELRKQEGCVAVEMEVSACQAVSDFRGFELYNFLYSADNLGSLKWDKGILNDIAIDERLQHFFIALEIAKEVVTMQNKSHDIKLIKPTLEYVNDIMAMRQELLDANDEFGYFAGCNGLQNFDNAESWIKQVESRASKENCKEGSVPSNVYLAVRISDNKIVGIIDLRHHINHPILGTWGGHVGYSIRPSERRKGYGREVLRRHISNCKEFGLEKILLTCDERNKASEKVILSNGGIFESIYEHDGISTKRYWIEFKK